MQLDIQFLYQQTLCKFAYYRFSEINPDVSPCNTRVIVLFKGRTNNVWKSTFWNSKNNYRSHCILQSSNYWKLHLFPLWIQEMYPTVCKVCILFINIYIKSQLFIRFAGYWTASPPIYLSVIHRTSENWAGVLISFKRASHVFEQFATCCYLWSTSYQKTRRFSTSSHIILSLSVHCSHSEYNYLKVGSWINTEHFLVQWNGNKRASCAAKELNNKWVTSANLVTVFFLQLCRLRCHLATSSFISLNLYDKFSQLKFHCFHIGTFHSQKFFTSSHVLEGFPYVTAIFFLMKFSPNFSNPHKTSERHSEWNHYFLLQLRRMYS